jgi:hypothetical protein
MKLTAPKHPMVRLPNPLKMTNTGGGEKLYNIQIKAANAS